MPAGRARGRLPHRARLAGFSLIELLVGISVLGVLLALALPAFSDWIRNNQIRVVAESLREGLQLARSEAVKRNARVRLQLVSTLDNSCTLSASGPYWIVNVGASVSPAGACASAAGGSASPFVVQASPATAAATRVTVSIVPATAVIAFDASGRLVATQNPTTGVAVNRIDISMPGGCFPSGTVRCLRLLVFPAGEVRMCDPSQTAVTDPTRC